MHEYAWRRRSRRSLGMSLVSMGFSERSTKWLVAEEGLIRSH
jgi:hypothetical protein